MQHRNLKIEKSFLFNVHNSGQAAHDSERQVAQLRLRHNSDRRRLWRPFRQQGGRHPWPQGRRL